jgi:glycosyltransferase involved in cell wall biosynthesis
MRILYLSPTGSLGGAERVLLSVLGSMRQARPDAQLHLLALADGPLLGLAARLGVRTTLLPLPAELTRLGDSQLAHGGRARRWAALLWQTLRAAPASWGYARRLREAIRCAAPDLIHSNGIKTHLLARLAGTGGVPVVWHAHDFYSSRPVVRRLLGWARGRAAGALAISEAVARDLGEAVPGLPVRRVYNTVDTEAFSPAQGDGDWLDAASGRPPGGAGVVRVGLVATYARWKGQALFLEAVARLSAAPPPVPVRCYLIGGPIYQTAGSQYTEAELRALAGRLNITDQVGFIGFQQDPAAVYRSLDVVVHASTQPEPFGLTILEAMSCGRAVVAARAGGAAELFLHDEDALGFPPGDSEALAGAIRALAADPERRRRLADSARQTALGRFSRDGLGGRIQTAYAELLGARRGDPRPDNLRRPLVSPFPKGTH